MQNRKVRQWIYFFFFLLLQSKVLGQITVAGPLCVLPGLEYQYNISGNLSTITTIQWCVAGGVIVGTDSTCTSGSLRLIRVKWNAVTSGSIILIASGNNVSVDVKITKAFGPGNINFSSRIQDAKKNQPPSSIICSYPDGGGCDPKYAFQWEESVDGMKWTEISGAVYSDLKFTSKPKQTMYYRRKVVETGSNLIGYSDAAIILIKPTK